MTYNILNLQYLALKKEGSERLHLASILAARLSPGCTKRRPAAFRPVLADRFGFSIFYYGGITIPLPVNKCHIFSWSAMNLIH